MLKVLLIRGEGIILKHSEQLFAVKSSGNQVHLVPPADLGQKVLVSGTRNVQKVNFPLSKLQVNTKLADDRR